MNYFIAFTVRTGSGILCDLIGKTRRMGVPWEYFCVLPNLDLPPKTRWGKTTWREHYLAYLQQPRTANGITGAKLTWDSLSGLIKGLGNLPDVDRWVRLRRRDTLRQAISRYKASYTATWELRGIAELPPDPPFDRDTIMAMEQTILEEESRWDGFFEARQPLVLWYEDWINSPGVAVQQIADHLGVGRVVIGKTDWQRMSNGVSEQWYSELSGAAARQGVSSERVFDSV